MKKLDILQKTLPLCNAAKAELPLVGLGTWKLHAPHLQPVLERAIELGCRHIDCAAIYENEEEIGKVLSQVFANKERFRVERKDLFITSKLWNTKHAREDVLAACEKTLQDLQLPYLDLYLIHWPFSFETDARGYSRLDENGVAVIRPVSLSETWSAMEELVKQGKVRAIGVSNFTARHLGQIMDAQIKPAINQVEMHPYLPQPQLLKFCADNGIKVVAYSALGSGETPSLLTDATVVKVAHSLNMTPAQVLLSWAITRGTAVIPKTNSPQRLEENYDLRPLDAESMHQLDTISTHHRFICPVSYWKLDCFDHD